MSPVIPVSWGELIDKVTILEIKAERLSSATALANVRHELALLRVIAAEIEKGKDAIEALKKELKSVNETLWQVEDDIREKEAGGRFDADFIALARAVYRHNDRRGQLKREINVLSNSDIAEEKQYSSY